jgi:hypothetical protein
MIENAKLDRLLTQVNCRITSIARLRDAGAISERKAEQELKQAVELRAKLCGRSTAKILPLTPKYLEARAHTEGTEKLRRKSAALCAFNRPLFGCEAQSAP